MPQVFWATCPKCGNRFTADKILWDRDLKLMCPNCRHYFERMESPHIETVWPVTYNDLRRLQEKLKEECKP